MTRQKSVLCVGKATQDVFLRDDEFDPLFKGKVAYTSLPLGSKIDIESLAFATGGNATNVAVTLARQGLHSRYLWALGNDPASLASLAVLDEEGVDTSAVVQHDSLTAGYSAILIATSGERTVLNYKGNMPNANDVVRLLNLTKKPDWVYPTSVGSVETLEKIVSWANNNQVKVMLNPAETEFSQPAKLRGLLDGVDVLCLNKQEMQTIVEGDDTETLVRHGLNYCPVVIVTDGSNGFSASDGKTLVQAGLYENIMATDRTGAGDAFASGFLSQWLYGKSFRESLVFASANSSNVVANIGAKTGILPFGASLHAMEMTEKEI